MKKWFLGIIAGLAVLPMVGLAQNIGDIDISFCNSGIKNDNYFTLITEAGKTENLCVNIRNTSRTPMTIHIDFVDGAISDQGNSVCFAPDYSQKEFSKYISNFETDVNLEGGEEIQKIYELKYPIGFSGLSHGCISYYISSDENNEGVSMVFRKVNRIDILVGGIEVSSRIKIKDVFYTGDNEVNKLGFLVENEGNINQEVMITGFIKGWFGYQEDFDLGFFKLGAGDSVVVYTNELHMPWYKGRFHANSYISNQPDIDFSISQSNIYDNEYSVAGTMFAHKPFFLWNWLLVVLVALVVILVVVMICRVAKVHKTENNKN